MDLDPTQLIRFYRAIPDAVDPVPASKSAAGTAPTKATQRCVPFQAAAGEGWYVYLPCDLALRWNGHTTIEWWLDGDYHGVLDGENTEAIQYPGFADAFDGQAPAPVQGYAPPFLTAAQEPGLVEVWSGWLVRTAPNWSLRIRSLVNYPRPAHYDVLEALIETDWWFGALPTNLRLAQTHDPIRFPATRPLFQLQLAHRSGYQGPHLTDTRSLMGGEMPWDAEDWDAYYETMVRPRPALGWYAHVSRRRAPADPL